MVQTSEDRVREMIRNFNEVGMDSLHPRWSEGRPATFTPKVRARIIRIATRDRHPAPGEVGLPFTTWSLAKLRDHLVKRRVGVVDLQGAAAPDPGRGADHLPEDQDVEGVTGP